MEHPYGLAHSDNFLYWTEFQNGTVQRLEMSTLAVSTLSVENYPLYELRVFDNSTQEGKWKIVSVAGVAFFDLLLKKIVILLLL
jgi:hypothetical protein